MKWTKRSVMELTAAFVMTAAVITLAILQYRSTDEIGRDEQSRLNAAVGTSVKAFNDEFSYEFQRLCEGFELDPEASENSLDSAPFPPVSELGQKHREPRLDCRFIRF